MIHVARSRPTAMPSPKMATSVGPGSRHNRLIMTLSSNCAEIIVSTNLSYFQYPQVGRERALAPDVSPDELSGNALGLYDFIALPVWYQ